MKTSAEADFRAFVVSRWPRMLRTAYLLTGHHHDAEDLVQAALAKAYTKWERVQRTDDPDAYVWRIMINANVDRLRLLKVREWLTTRFPESTAPQAADRADQIIDRSLLMDALERLTRRQRTVLVLRFLEDRSESEVARLLGTRVGTVRSHTARALAKLRRDGAVLDMRRDRAAASPVSSPPSSPSIPSASSGAGARR